MGQQARFQQLVCLGSQNWGRRPWPKLSYHAEPYADPSNPAALSGATVTQLQFPLHGSTLSHSALLACQQGNCLAPRFLGGGFVSMSPQSSSNRWMVAVVGEAGVIHFLTAWMSKHKPGKKSGKGKVVWDPRRGFDSTLKKCDLGLSKQLASELYKNK